MIIIFEVGRRCGKRYALEMTHYQRIYDYMSKFGSISPMEAYDHLGETKLSTRIGEMKRRGIEIEGREEVGKNRFGQEVRYMRYRLAEKKNVAGSVIVRD